MSSQYAVLFFALVVFILAETALANPIDNTVDGGKQCHFRCGQAPWHIAGQCNTTTGRCKCVYGWSGPNSRYIPGTRNIIEADYCMDACHYTHDHRNPRCIYKQKGNFVKECDSKCGKGIFYGTGECQESGQCLCWWGWTGPGAKYVSGGASDKQITADQCTMRCHYTHDYSNPLCASN